MSNVPTNYLVNKVMLRLKENRSNFTTSAAHVSQVITLHNMGDDMAEPSGSSLTAYIAETYEEVLEQA